MDSRETATVLSDWFETLLAQQVVHQSVALAKRLFLDASDALACVAGVRADLLQRETLVRLLDQSQLGQITVQIAFFSFEILFKIL